MLQRVLTFLVVVSLPGFALQSIAGEPKAELQQLVQKINSKLKSGKTTEQDLAEDLKGFDTLLAEHFMEAMLYAQVFENNSKAMELFQRLKTDFPDTKQAKQTDQIIATLTKQAEASKIQKTLVEGSQFPEFNEKDLAGKPLSVANYKGKIVMVDFWATWCGPCVAELPNVLKVYQKYHDKGFEIIGVSLDEDKDKLTSFIKEKNMKWPQYFDGKGWQNKLAAQYGITSIPATYLLDKDGKIIGKGLRGEKLEEAVGKAVAAK